MSASVRVSGWVLLLSLFLIRVASSQSYNQLYVKYGEAAGNRFGNSVATIGDMDADGKSEFIIGAPNWDTSATWGSDRGSVYIYKGSDGTLLYVKRGCCFQDRRFGWSVAGAGDVNGDGKPDFIVGEPYLYPSFPIDENGSGKAYVYSGATGDSLCTLCDPVACNNRIDYFGQSVAGVGDVDGDGKSEVIAGAPFAPQIDLYDPSTGAATLFSGGNCGWIFSKSGSSVGDSLGYSVAGTGDVNGDGKPDFIIGAPSANPGNKTDAGSAFVVAKTGTNYTILYQVDGVAAGDNLGLAVSGIGDIYGNDGKSEFIIGAPWHDTLGMNNVGKVYVFNGATGQPIFVLKGGAAADLFGSSVAGIGDVNGDGKADFAIGAPRADTAGLIDAGAVYIYSGADGSLLFKKYGNANYDYLGYSVSGGGDVNGDGKADFIIGVPQSNPGGLDDAGAVYVYGFFDTTPPSVTVTDPNGGEYVSKSPCPAYAITWNASDNVGVTEIEIWLDRTNNGSFEQQIANLSGNPGSYEWTVTGSNSNNAKIKVIARDAAGNSSSDVSDGVFTIGPNCYLKPVAILPTFDLGQNYPNPFNANTNISFSLDAPSTVELVVYNMLGVKVRTLVNESRPAGTYEVAFDGRDDKGKSLSSGTYFYKLTASDKVVTKQMVLIK